MPFLVLNAAGGDGSSAVNVLPAVDSVEFRADQITVRFNDNPLFIQAPVTPYLAAEGARSRLDNTQTITI